jgi:hypothetical protein
MTRRNAVKLRMVPDLGCCIPLEENVVITEFQLSCLSEVPLHSVAGEKVSAVAVHQAHRARPLCYGSGFGNDRVAVGTGKEIATRMYWLQTRGVAGAVCRSVARADAPIQGHRVPSLLVWLNAATVHMAKSARARLQHT